MPSSPSDFQTQKVVSVVSEVPSLSGEKSGSHSGAVPSETSRKSDTLNDTTAENSAGVTDSPSFASSLPSRGAPGAVPASPVVSPSESRAVTVCLTPGKDLARHLDGFADATAAHWLEGLHLASLAPALREEKDGAAFVPARPRPPHPSGLYTAANGAPLTPLPYRRNENFDELSLLVLDHDGADEAPLRAALERLRARGLWFLTYPTHSYGAGEKPFRFRMVFPLSEPVPASSWRSAWNKLVQHLELEHLAAVDKSTRDVARLHYLPSWNPNKKSPRPLPEHHRGSPIDVAKVLGELQPPPDLSPLAPVPFHEGTMPAPLRELRQRLQNYLMRSGTKVTRALFAAAERGEVLSLDGCRHDALRSATWVLAEVAKPEWTSESLLEVLRPSLAAFQAVEPGRGVQIEALRLLEGARGKVAQSPRARRAASFAAFLSRLPGHHEVQP
jgi:hypothetical protein